jgi:Tol biopolymer transport system component
VLIRDACLTTGVRHRLLRALAAAAVVAVPAASAQPTDRAAPSLAYASDVAGSLDLSVARLGANATPRRLAASPSDEFSPSWSPDGKRIAYRVNPPRSDVGDVWVMRANCTRKRNLTHSPRVADWSPAWSPDGRSIAYFSASAGGGDVWVMRVDGSGKRRVTRDGQLSEYPSWSPDGRRLVFNSHRDGQFEIYRFDGRTSRNLTRHPARDQWPAWSPDGTLIAFMSERDGSEDVFVMRPGGGGVRNLTRTAGRDESHPSWMPDGRLSFTRHAETGPIELWAIEPDGSAAARLPTAAEPVFVFAWKPEP